MRKFNMREFKRDNWTNEEVIKFLQGEKFIPLGKQQTAEWMEHHNTAVDDCIEIFRDFQRPSSEPGAMGFCVEEDTTFHIGPPLSRMTLEDTSIPCA